MSLVEALATSFSGFCLQVHTLKKEYTYSETEERKELHRFPICGFEMLKPYRDDQQSFPKEWLFIMFSFAKAIMIYREDKTHYKPESPKKR